MKRYGDICNGNCINTIKSVSMLGQTVTILSCLHRSYAVWHSSLKTSVSHRNQRHKWNNLNKSPDVLIWHYKVVLCLFKRPVYWDPTIISFLLIECCFQFFTCVPTIEITKYLSSLLECLDVYWLTKFELLPFCVKMEDYICYKLALKALDLNPFTWWTCSERISEKEVKFMALSVVTLECLAFLFERWVCHA